MMPILLVVSFLLLFMTMRGQNKKQKQIEASLKTGETVVTQAGLIGKIVTLGEREVKLEIAPGVNVRVLKSAIQGIDPGETKSGDAKDAKDAKDGKQEKKA